MTDKQLYKKAKEAYYNGSPIMTDRQFDLLEDKIRLADPDWAPLHQTGVPAKKTKCKLARPMPSLSKVYPAELSKWLAKNPSENYVVMMKLDGASVQLIGGERPRLITRGNGEVGGDITHLMEYLNLPKASEGEVLRMEAVMSKTKYKKWAAEFDNPRNMVSGLLNRKQPHPAMRDIEFRVLGAYGERIERALKARPKSRVTYFLATSKAVKTEGYLEKVLDDWKKKGDFDIDGLVLAVHDFRMDYENAEKPNKGIVAFKVNPADDVVQVRVKSVVWQVAASKRLTPKIEIEPTKVGDVMVRYVTAHNAVWLEERGIGPGAVVEVIRSGGVIPKIVGVTRKGKPSHPDVAYKARGVHLYQIDNTGVNSLRIVKFVTTLGIDYLGRSTVTKALKKLPTELDYLRAWKAGNLASKLTSAGVAAAMANKIVQQFDKVIDCHIPLTKLMDASQMFPEGMGERKLNMLGAHNPNWLTNPPTLEDLQNVPRWGVSTADDYLRKFHAWRNWWSEFQDATGIRKLPVAKEKVAKTSNKLLGYRVSFTGYRDQEQEAAIAAAGGEVVPFGARTNALLVKAGGKASSKVEKAKAKSIKVCEFKDLGI